MSHRAAKLKAVTRDRSGDATIEVCRPRKQVFGRRKIGLMSKLKNQGESLLVI